MKGIFIARFEKDGITRSLAFRKSEFDEAKAGEHLRNMGVNNFFMFFEPAPPVDIDENTVLFSGDVGFDITLDTVLPVLKEGKTIVFDSYGGDLWEGLKMYDAIKALGANVEVGILGSCISAATLPLCAATKRWTTPNSRLLIHNAWSWVVGDAATLKKEADALAEENLGAAKIYAELTGATVAEMLELMNEERVMRAGKMLQRGFVNEIKNQKKEEEMDSKEFEKKLKAQEESIMNKIQAFFRKNSVPKNAVLQDVAGNEFDFGDEIEDLEQVEVGTSATIDGAPASGEYPFPNGKTYVFEAGVVIEIRDTEEGGNDEEVEELKEEVEELKEEVEELKEELAAVNASFRKQLKAIKAEFSALKNAYNNKPPIAPAEPGADPVAKPKKGFVYNGKK